MINLTAKYKISQFRLSSRSLLFQIAINEKELLYGDLPTKTFAQRLTKAKLLADVTQVQLAELTGLSKSAIDSIESGKRDNIKIDTLKKLITVLDEDILCNDYHRFILHQEENIKELINSYGFPTLLEKLSVHRSTLERYRDGKIKISRKMYYIICRDFLN